MPLNETEIAEIKTAVEAGNYTANPLLAPLATLGLVFRSGADETSYKGTVEKDTADRVTNTIRTEFEKSIEEETGIKKNSGEKATDYLKRATGGLKTELAELKDKKEDGEATKKDKLRITELEKLLGTKDEEVKKAATDYGTKLMEYRVGGEVRAAQAAVTAKLVKTLTGEAREDVIEARVNKFKNEYTPELEGEGDAERIVYKKKDGSYANDTKGKRLTTEEILTDVFGTYVDKGQKQEGAGTLDKDKKKKEGEKVEADNYSPGADVTTKSLLHKDLQKAGFLKGTKEFNELYKKHSDGLKIS